MLRQPYIQARCNRCHDQELAETPIYNQGKLLFESSGCLGRHRLVGKAGTEGPEGVTTTDAQMDQLALHRHNFHGDWNYRLRPRKTA